MRFESLEQKLRKFLRNCQTTSNETQKARLRTRILSAFREHQRKPTILNWIQIIFQTPRLRFASLVASVLVVVGLTALVNKDTIAGEVEHRFGRVEIVRDGQTHIVRERTKLKVGDIVRVADNSNATLTLPQKITSTLNPETSVRIVDKDKLYLSQGLVKSQAFGTKGQISTSRGIVKPNAGAEFQVKVSETGQTTVALAKNSAEILDWLDGRMVLSAGEELKLRVDSAKLDDVGLPKHVKLSLAQINAIKSKLSIARTKFFNGLEKKIAKKNSGDKEIDSAERTFRSIIQVLKSDRHLNILRRANPVLLKNEDVHAALQQKSSNQALLSKVKAVETLFALYHKGDGRDLFLSRGQSVFFNRYTLIDQIFSRGDTDQMIYARSLKNEYVVGLLQKIINQEIKMDQVAIMSQEINKLPAQSRQTKAFLKDLSTHLDAYLNDILAEKVQTL